MSVLEVIKAHKANQVDIMVDYNYMALHKKCVTLTNQGIVKATGSGVPEDLTFKISEGSDQN